MKLNKKFSLLVIWLGFQTVILSLLLIFMFNTVFQLKDFQSRLAGAQYAYERLSGFTNTVDARGVDMDTMYSEWTERLDEANKQFAELNTHKARSYMDSDMNEMVDNIGSLWGVLEGQLTDLSASYEQLSKEPVSSMFKNTVRQSGFKNAIEMYQSVENVSDTEFQLNSIRIKEGSIYYAYESFTELVNNLSAAMTDLVDTQRRNSNVLMLSITILSALIMVVIVRLTTKSMTKRIYDIQKMTTGIAGKDFTIRGTVSVKDEVGDLQRDLNETVGHLNEIFLRVKKSAEIAESSSLSINNAAGETAAATHQINASIESMTKQFDMLSSAVRRSLESIAQMNSVSSVLVQDNTVQSKSIEESNVAIKEMAKTLEEMSVMANSRTQSAQEMQQLVLDGDEKIAATNTLLEEITSQLDEVREIVTIINAIAEQTNLLSMNAAIESAHAGDSGKGFGVVAEEIRTLAEGTGENAKRITNSIYAIIDKVKEANSSSSTASEAFTKVSERTQDLLSSLRDISEGIASIDDRTKRIADRTNEIAGAADKINGYCEKLSEHQEIASTQVTTMNDVFSQAMNGISEIRDGTEDIVQRMRTVSEMSSDSCTKMSDLESVLSEFKTNDPAASPEQQESAAVPQDMEEQAAVPTV
jgi:methyl-accepting chemotaxis protein